jgi:hypothetical protein
VCIAIDRGRRRRIDLQSVVSVADRESERESSSWLRNLAQLQAAFVVLGSFVCIDLTPAVEG